MRNRTKAWLLWSAVAATVMIGILAGTGWYLSGKLEPLVRERTVAFLSQCFDGDVALKGFHISMPVRDPLKVLLNKGRGARIKVKVTGILLRQRGAREDHPLLRLRSLTFDLDVSRLFDSPAVIDVVHVEGMELALPPKGERRFSMPSQQSGAKDVNVLIGRIVADGTRLVILPKDRTKAPLEFDLHKLTLESAGTGVAMGYVTTMKNARPPGVIDCSGTFGPYVTEEPGDTPLTGIYVFRKADLGVFKGIAGMLHSTGSFHGTMDKIVVDGETTVPDFRLPAANNPMKLTTQFHAIVDGTNGDTRLEPVKAKLGDSPILCRGSVVRYPGENGKTVTLNCQSKNGRLDDFLHLAVKGNRPPMTGRVDFDIEIVVPPEKVPYAEKLQLAGPFKLREGLFTNPKVQAKLDDMSRRAQGRPTDMSLTGATSNFEGRMVLKRQSLTIRNLVFRMEGAMVRLSGKYDMKADTVDFHGQVRTEARLSQMMKTTWKRIALKPVDPIFAKDGAGAQFDVAITGPADSPAFGLEKRK